MKKILIIIVAFLVICSFSLNVSAKQKDASLSVSSRTAESGNIYIFASINDIKTSGGISYLEYSIKYDPKVLKLKNSMVNIPSTWGSDAEDWSKVVSDGEYCWSVFNVALGYAVKEDNQLFIELEFIPLTDNATTDIVFDCIEICGDDLSPLDGKSVTFGISVAKDEDDKIVVSDTTVTDKDNPNSNNQQNKPSTDLSDSKTDSGADVSNGSSNNSYGSDTSNSALNGGSSSDNDGDMDSNAIIIVSVILAVIGAGIAVIFFVNSKKGNK